MELGRYKPWLRNRADDDDEEEEVGGKEPAASKLVPAVRTPEHVGWCKSFVYGYAYPCIGKQAMGKSWGVKAPPSHLTVMFVFFAILKVLNTTPSNVIDEGSYLKSPMT